MPHRQTRTRGSFRAPAQGRRPVAQHRLRTLFVLSVLIVFRVFPYYWGLLAVVVALLVLDFKAVLHVDYGLLLTFCAFFVFSGNLARIPQVEDFLGWLVALDPLAFGTLSCQIISNVPSAVLLSRFTQDYLRLLIAVNIGGLGTPIASLASLITLNNYRRFCPGDTKRYILLFLALNFSFLAILLGSGYFNGIPSRLKKGDRNAALFLCRFTENCSARRGGI